MTAETKTCRRGDRCQWILCPVHSPRQGDQRADTEERAAVAAMPASERPHYELNDGTCVTCGEPWMCQTAATKPCPVTASEWPAADDTSWRAVAKRWECLYREAVGIPVSEHQRRRMEAMAEALEAATAAWTATRRRGR